MSRPRRALPAGLLAAAVAAAIAAGAWWVIARSRGGGDVPSAVVRRGDLNVSVSSRGKLAARQAAVLLAPNRVQNLRILYLAPGGSEVRKGEVVIRLDASGLQQKADELALGLKAAQTQLEEAQNQTILTRQQDARTLAQDQAAAGRAEVEAKKQSVQGRIAGEEARLALDVARAVVANDLAQSKLHATAAAAQLQSLTEARDKAGAQWRRSRQAIEAASIRAPLSGLIAYSMNYSTYNDVHPYRVGDTVSAGDEIGQIPDLHSLELDATLTQDDRGRVQPGDRVQAQATALPEVQLSGKLQTIAELTSLDFGGTFPPPRVFNLVATLDHPDPRLRAQMTVAVQIITRQLHAVALVPSAAVFARGPQPVVFVLQGDAYRARPVAILGRNATDVAVRGVAPGERVALKDPTARPLPGAPASAADAAGMAGPKP